MFRKWRSRGHREKGKESIKLFRSAEDEMAIPTQHVCGLIERPKSRSCYDGADRMEPEQKRSNHAKIPPAAADGPEKIREFVFTSSDEATVGQNHVRADEI